MATGDDGNDVDGDGETGDDNDADDDGDEGRQIARCVPADPG